MTPSTPSASGSVTTRPGRSCTCGPRPAWAKGPGSSSGPGAFEFAADEPASVGGTGTAPNPVQLALAALGSCQAITYRYWAEELGLRLDAVTITVEADFDTGAFFGFPGRPGRRRPTAVRCSVTLEGPESAERYEKLIAAVDEHCPVLDLFTRPVPVERTVTTGVTRTTTLPAILSCSA